MIFRILVILILLFAVPSFAADICVGPSSSGNGLGGDWSNIAQWSTLSFTRGNTYYLQDGDYGYKALSTTASSTTTITIKKATATDHATETGWVAGYGDGQATWTGLTRAWYISTPYWIIDGQAGSGSTASSYGFYITASASADTTPVRFGDFSDTANNVQISHTAVVCPGVGSDSYSQYGFSGYGDSVTLDYVYVNDCQVSAWTQGDDMTISNSYFGTFWSTGGHHGVHIEVVLRPILKYNFFAECDNMCIEPGGGSETDIDNGQFYGNVAIDVGVNGFAKGVSNGAIDDSVFYNNTLVNATGPLLYPSNYGSASGNILQNNLLYNCSAGLAYDHSGEIAEHSYNAFFDSGSPSETGVQVASGNPFINSAGGNYHLAYATNAGYTLSSPYNTDHDSLTRGSDGTWDIGAYEYQASITLTSPTGIVLSN